MKNFYAEWQAQDAILLAFPHEDSDWNPYLSEVRELYYKIIFEILQVESCILICKNRVETISLIKQYSSNNNLNLALLKNLYCIPLNSNDTWARDFGGITIKKGKKTWVRSKNYEKLILKRRDLYRKQAILREQSHNKLANKILSLGNEFRIEKVNYKGLQKRVKGTKVSEKTGKFKSKKRFGKSLSNRAPAKFIEILQRKLLYFEVKLKYINTAKVKASQFNHIDQTYVKKALSNRWNTVGENKVQRDIYSSFLIKNTTNTLDTIDIGLCNKTFDKFLKLHNEVIDNIKNEKHLRNKRILKCFGI